MRFTRVVYTVAAVYGLLVLAPLYFLLDRVGREAPPAVTHPEFYYGFVGLAILWQLVFLLIARDPVHYRALIPITILEKLVYAVPGLLVYAHGRLDAKLLPRADHGWRSRFLFCSGLSADAAGRYATRSGNRGESVGFFVVELEHRVET